MLIRLQPRSGREFAGGFLRFEWDLTELIRNAETFQRHAGFIEKAAAAEHPVAVKIKRT